MHVFEKYNATGYPDALFREADGLELLTRTLALGGNHELKVPQVLEVDEHCLRLPKIETRPATHELMRRLGEGLANLHRHHAQHYGLERDNYIGLAPQPNGISQDWGRFFVEQRLLYQILRIDNKKQQYDYRQRLDARRQNLIEFLNASCLHPSLVHGDLWSGNVLFDTDSVWLIDPAPYYGDREVDLAMTEMFGGFDSAFYQAYDRVYPRTEHYSLKREIYNLYHYLNHLNLFGRSYLDGCERGLSILETF